MKDEAGAREGRKGCLPSEDHATTTQLNTKAHCTGRRSEELWAHLEMLGTRTDVLRRRLVVLAAAVLALFSDVCDARACARAGLDAPIGEYAAP